MQTQHTPWPRKRIAAAAMAAFLAVALLMGGAYAVTQTLADTADALTYTALLHSDTSTDNKDVYVENTGTGPLYVRVKFAEYLQVSNQSVTPAYDATGATSTTTALATNVGTWAVHTWTSTNTNLATATSTAATGTAATSYYQWKLGTATTGSKTFFAGINGGDSTGRAGYSQTQFDALDADTELYVDGVKTKKISTLPASDAMFLETYNTILAAKRTCTNAASHELCTVDKTTDPTHVCAHTACDTCGWYDGLDTVGRWLLDTDGWAYWSRPLAAGTATNLLLDEVTPVATPVGGWQYDIDVQMQVASEDEVSQWFSNNDVTVTKAEVPSNTTNNVVANPNNTTQTGTQAALTFLLWSLNEDLYATGIIQEAAASAKDPDGNTYYYSPGNNVYVELTYNPSTMKYTVNTDVIVAGNDLDLDDVDDPTNTAVQADNGYLAGRASGGVKIDTVVLAADNPVASIVNPTDITNGTIDRLTDEAYYTIQGAASTYYVTAGADGKLGTYDDVIYDSDMDTATGGKLGINAATGEAVGWHYMGGTVNKMMLLGESLIGASEFSRDTWKYASGKLPTLYNTYYNTTLTGSKSAILTSDITISDPYKDGQIYYGIGSCTTTSHYLVSNVTGASYHSNTTDRKCRAAFTYAKAFSVAEDFAEVSVTSVKFFAPSLQEIIDAYSVTEGESSAANPIRVEVPVPSVTYNQTCYWLRTPGFDSYKGTVVYFAVEGYKGKISAGGLILTGTDTAQNPGGVIAACYANLADTANP